MVWPCLLFLRVDRVLSLLLFACICAPRCLTFVDATLVNVTIDDTFGDQFYTSFPQYTHPFLPPHEHPYARYPKYIPNTNTVPPVWKPGPMCTDCGVNLDPGQVMNGTWYDGSWKNQLKEQTRVEFTFWGTSIYVYTIISNRLSDLQSYEFYIDNPNLPVGNFTHSSDGSDDFEYNYLLYSNTALNDGEHIFTLASTKPDQDDETNNDLLMLLLFDYAVYTIDIDTDAPSSASPTPTQHSPALPSLGTPASDAETRSVVRLYQALSGLLGSIAAISVGVCVYLLRDNFRKSFSRVFIYICV
ncbi:hypothetical protein AB1N83_008823 [Pleurotus pulmonarius]